MPGSPEGQASTRSSSRTGGSRTSTRRQAICALGTAASAATAGCLGGLPGLGPGYAGDPAVLAENDRRLAWSIPHPGADDERIGYVEVAARRPLPAGFGEPTAAFEFTAGVPLRGGWELSRFAARFRTPEAYQQERGDVSFLVESPGQWEGFTAYHERTGVSRDLVVELRDIEADGSIAVPFVVVPPGDPLPQALRCAFEVAVSKPGWLERTFVASDQGWFEFNPDP